MTSEIIVPPPHADVELFDARMIGSNYGRLVNYKLRYRRFDGTWSNEISRDCFDSGPAVIVLPYDPTSDEVVLIKQFRAGPWAIGAEPWILEIPAGRLDKDGVDAAGIAVAEAREEAGLTVMALEPIAKFFASPGIFTEHLTAFCGRISNAQPGHFGLPEENEDIKTEVYKADDAIALAYSGAITSGPTLLSLYWLQANRERLRAAWR
ncbi:MAG: NUDIX domain-containing protein [Alphaproteobacteria bacterium]